MIVKLLSFIILLLTISPTFADEHIVIPNLSTISELAKEVVAKKITADATAKIIITPQNLEGRQSPPRCYEPIDVSLASEREISRTNTVKVSCDSPDLAYPWQIYLSVRVSIEYPVVVAKDVLAHNKVLSANDLAVAYVDQYSLRGDFFANKRQLLGTRVKRKVSKGSPLLKRNLCFVCKGDPVSIWAKTASFEIKTTGEAMKDGNVGDMIKVKNTNSNKLLDAQVIGIGEVEVRM
ncbi:flagellar basal body P-ring formation chaperone FlgA [Shewanella intestini]|uniref:Flagella basal body P-ring formation protein FlgA n=1 Tax=Shewanella intestini TaxID=2017544 RepID=A0ABS5HY86_9GAMM|nr:MULTISPECIES: flagellar basal body P-ring formation chaperone FlgA [Shewanella]MBR9726744.1 flagellar basal body P-ring formation protein FlgA [Shewanella intestini]MRG34690.1 flagellar basal body P-ring formation protein FlgA [Shewanella sp. XMDDZSB0408]